MVLKELAIRTGGSASEEDYVNVESEQSGALTPVTSTMSFAQDDGDQPPAYSGWASSPNPTGPRVSIHPLQSEKGLIIKVNPPSMPTDSSLVHVPCSIVLVIDVSASMSLAAPAPMANEEGGTKMEDYGLSILDLVKHSARTIIESLNGNDRLGIVTFSDDATVLLDSVYMTPANKTMALREVDAMQPDGRTNLWRGMYVGLEMFNKQNNATSVPAMMVLTDGLPNMNPQQGYVRKITDYLPLPASIHTFGFGYSIDSGLLRSIAEIGGGNFSFIPDAGMIGNAFIHSVAHLQSTYAIDCELAVHISAPASLEITTGCQLGGLRHKSDGGQLIINLDNIQYSQSRDIFLRYKPQPGAPANWTRNHAEVALSLRYKPVGGTKGLVNVSAHLNEPENLAPAESAYHQSRSMVGNFLSSMFPLKVDQSYNTDIPSMAGHRAPHRDFDSLRTELNTLIKEMPAAAFPDDPKIKALMEDLTGQVTEGLSTVNYFNKWGRHYFLSLMNAHVNQICLSFKDPGPLCYNTDSELFKKCRKVLDMAFDNLPAPKPSRPPPPSYRSSAVGGVSSVVGSMLGNRTYARAPLRMSNFNSRSAPCFAGSAKVVLANGQSTPISKLRKGTAVRTPSGTRVVAAVLKTRVSKIVMCRVGSLIVTPWHPIRQDASSASSGQEWVFPARVAEQSVRYSGAIYSILLQRDNDIEAHAIRIEGFWGVTLGHGMLAGHDVRAHPFLGDYSKVSKALGAIGVGRDGLALSKGLKRGKTDGAIKGFKRSARANATQPVPC